MKNPCKKFVFVHLPKTGGTAVENILRFDNRVWHKSDYKCPNPENFDILMGHFHRNYYPYSPRITILRHPIERIISHYSTWKRRLEIGKTTVIGKPSTQMSFPLTSYICEFAERLGNLYAEYGVNCKDFNYIGFTECLDIALIELSERFNFKLPDVIQSVNSGYHLKITEKEHEKLRKILVNDIEIYKEAKDVFGKD